MTFYPRDLTPLSVYEETEWVGTEGQCDKCRNLYFIQAPYYSGCCPKCEYGWVTVAPRMQKRLEQAPSGLAETSSRYRSPCASQYRVVSSKRLFTQW